jgi:hypothetical protein
MLQDSAVPLRLLQALPPAGPDPVLYGTGFFQNGGCPGPAGPLLSGGGGGPGSPSRAAPGFGSLSRFRAEQGGFQIFGAAKPKLDRQA